MDHSFPVQEAIAKAQGGDNEHLNLNNGFSNGVEGKV